jgi:hypothetical protein
MAHVEGELNVTASILGLIISSFCPPLFDILVRGVVHASRPFECFFVARSYDFQGMSLRNTVFRSKASLGLIPSGNYFPFFSQFFRVGSM